SKFQEFLKIAQDKSRWAVILYTNSLFTKETPQKEPILGVEYLVKERSSKTDESIDAVSSMLTWNEPQNKEPIEFEAAYMDKKSLEFGTPVKNIFIPEDTTTEEHTVLEHIAPGHKGYYISKKTKKLINVLGHITIDAPQVLSSIESYVGAVGHVLAFVPEISKRYKEEFIRSNVQIYFSVDLYAKITITFSCDPFNTCDLLTKFFTEYQRSPAYLGNSISQKAQEYFQMRRSEHLLGSHPTYAIIKSKNTPFFDIDECLVVAKCIKAEDVTPVSEGEIKLYLFGNTCKEEFEELNEVITRFITPKEGTLKSKKPYLKKVNMGTSDPKNQVVALIHHVDIPSAYKSYIIASLLGIIKNGDFCEKLRGQECAGYALGMHRIQIAKENSVILFVQTTKSSAVIRKSMLEFLNSLGESFKKMTEDDFANYKESLKKIFESIENGDPNALFHSYLDLFQEIEYNVDIITLLKEELVSLTLSEFITYWDKNYKESELLQIHISKEFDKPQKKI
ncbi:hypothetical protein NEFER02_1730, partial [Nematocida sp. LUAm2]